jgi:hypothetical protein
MTEEQRDRTPPKNQPQAHMFHDLQTNKHGRYWNTAIRRAKLFKLTRKVLP